MAPIEYMVYLVPAAEEEESPGGLGETMAGGAPEEEESPEIVASLPVVPQQDEAVVAPPTEVPTEILPLTDSTFLTERIGTRRRLGTRLMVMVNCGTRRNSQTETTP